MVRILTEMGKDRGAQFEFECYDISHLYMLKHFVDRGLVKGPLFINLYSAFWAGWGLTLRT